MTQTVTLDESGIQTLRDNFSEVALRANRIRELLEMDADLRRMEHDLKRFLQRMNIEDSAIQAQIPALKEELRSFQTGGLPGLKSFTGQVQFLSKPLTGGAVNNPAARWLQEVEQQIPALRQALNDQAIKMLRDKADELDITLSGTRSDYQNVLKSEIRELCELAVRVGLQVK
jgi:hypothetical protein